MKRRARGKVADFQKLVPAYVHGSRVKDHIANVEGEPSMIALERFENERSLRGEIFADPTRPELWWLNKRVYRPPEPEKPYKKRRRKRK